MSKKLRKSHKNSALELAVVAVAHWAELEGLTYRAAVEELLDADTDDDWDYDDLEEDFEEEEE